MLSVTLPKGDAGHGEQKNEENLVAVIMAWIREEQGEDHDQNGREHTVYQTENWSRYSDVIEKLKTFGHETVNYALRPVFATNLQYEGLGFELGKVHKNRAFSYFEIFW